MIVLDASVMIALLNANDAHHVDAVALLSAHPNELVRTPTLTLAEALVRPAVRGRAESAAEQFRRRGIAELPPSRPLDLAQLRAASGLRMPDVIVLQAAVDAAAPLATFDARLARTAREHGVPVLP